MALYPSNKKHIYFIITFESQISTGKWTINLSTCCFRKSHKPVLGPNVHSLHSINTFFMTAFFFFSSNPTNPFITSFRMWTHGHSQHRYVNPIALAPFQERRSPWTHANQLPPKFSISCLPSHTQSKQYLLLNFLKAFHLPALALCLVWQWMQICVGVTIYTDN